MSRSPSKVWGNNWKTSNWILSICYSKNSSIDPVGNPQQFKVQLKICILAFIFTSLSEFQLLLKPWQRAMRTISRFGRRAIASCWMPTITLQKQILKSRFQLLHESLKNNQGKHPSVGIRQCSMKIDRIQEEINALYDIFTPWNCSSKVVESLPCYITNLSQPLEKKIIQVLCSRPWTLTKTYLLPTPESDGNHVRRLQAELAALDNTAIMEVTEDQGESTQAYSALEEQLKCFKATSGYRGWANLC